LNGHTAADKYVLFYKELVWNLEGLTRFNFFVVAVYKFTSLVFWEGGGGDFVTIYQTSLAYTGIWKLVLLFHLFIFSLSSEYGPCCHGRGNWSGNWWEECFSDYTRRKSQDAALDLAGAPEPCWALRRTREAGQRLQMRII
jgi:hypothetical protein